MGNCLGPGPGGEAPPRPPPVHVHPLPSNFSAKANGVNHLPAEPHMPSLHESDDEDSGDNVLKVFTKEQLVRATNNFSPRLFLGKGGFGQVHHGKLRMWGKVIPVAVKRLNQEGMDMGAKDWMTEIVNLGQLAHPNIVRLIGYCANGGEKMLVYEFMPRGSLDYHLFPLEEDGIPSHEVLPWETRFRIARQVASAIAYVHRNKFIHRDIKAGNVLLDENWDAKVTDFGLAREFAVDRSFVKTLVIGSAGYIDPHVMLIGEFRFSSDVYAFGVLVLELVTGRNAGHMRQDGVEDLPTFMKQTITAARRDVSQYVDPLIVHQLTKEDCKQVNVLARLGRFCTANEPSERPTMEDVLNTLEML